MEKWKRALLICFFPITLFGQEETKITSKVSEVKVFLKGANVTRTADTILTNGDNVLVFEKLPKDIDVSTIKLSLAEGHTIKNISHRMNYLQKEKKSNAFVDLKSQIDSMGLEIEESKMELGFVQEKIHLILNNKDLGINEQASVASGLESMLRIYNSELKQLRKEEIMFKRKLRTQNETAKNFKDQLRQTESIKVEPTLEVVVEVTSEVSGTVNATLSYFTPHASWFPVYDARVSDVDQDLVLQLKAQIIQSTPEEWKDVKVTLSNVNPDDSGQLPALEKWKLTYARWTKITTSKKKEAISTIGGKVIGRITDESGEPLIGATILVLGTSIGAVSDLDGSFEIYVPQGSKKLEVSYIGFNAKDVDIKDGPMNISLVESAEMLDEIVVTGYSVNAKAQNLSSSVRTLAGRASGVWSNSSRNNESSPIYVTADIIEKNNAINYEIKDRQTLKNNGKAKLVDIKDFILETFYEYHSTPKLKQDVYLIARIPDWDQYYFLEGEMNLYYEDSYVGKSLLLSDNFTDTLDLSLGIDYNVKINREEVKADTRKSFMGTNRIDSRSYTINVNNLKSTPINIFIHDQYPVSIIKDVDVSLENPDNAKVNETKGSLLWQRKVNARSLSNLNFSYKVKYPRREKVILE